MANMDNIVSQYMTKRRNYGKQPLFSEVSAKLLDSIDPSPDEQKRYILRNPLNQTTQGTPSQSEKYINTKTIFYQDQGINHVAGGWPKEINLLDEEAVSRYRRRVERDDSYVDAVLGNYSKMNHCIRQNNAIDMYQLYFKGMPSEKPIETSNVLTKNVFKDLDDNKRPVSSIDWTIEDDPKLVIAYCDKKYPYVGHRNKHFDCHVWNVEYPLYPSEILIPRSAVWQLVCSPASPRIIVGGLEDGRVCIFDTRVQQEAIAVSPDHLAHRDPVTAILYCSSRMNTDFFSGSTDGKCMWWDIRNLAHPTDSIIMNVQIPSGEQNEGLGNAEGISALQFDKSFPTRFLCGTDTGLVVNVNRKGKSHPEIISSVFRAHNGPVRAVHRSPLTTKMFLTCGDWTVRIWSDDILTSPIISGTGQRYQINDAIWAPQRISSYMCITTDGKFQYWDLLRKYREPVIIMPISKRPLLKLKSKEDGRLVAIGDDNGATFLLALSDSMVWSGVRDKPMMMQAYERETRREHILETRIKEIRLKLKEVEGTADAGPPVIVDEEAMVRTADEVYRKMVSDEIVRMGGANTTFASSMRKR